LGGAGSFARVIRLWGQSENGGWQMDFQVHEQTYFLSLAEDEKKWEVFVATPTGARPVRVYVDAAVSGPIVVLQEEKHRIPN
jgi:hypothetical protein